MKMKQARFLVIFSWDSVICDFDHRFVSDGRDVFDLRRNRFPENDVPNFILILPMIALWNHSLGNARDAGIEG